MKQKLDHHFDYCFEVDTNTKPRFVKISFDRLSKFNRLPFVYNTIYQKENDKNVYFVNFFFHWLEIEQINEILIEISKFELSIKKIVYIRQKFLFGRQMYMLVMLENFSVKMIDWEDS